ncbi:MAG: transposase [bacterium]
MEKIKKGKIKGYLTINKRIIFEGGVYHITQRAPGKEYLFLEENDYLQFLKVLKESVKKFNLELFCFSLLPNHLHLLLRINKENLSQAMKSLFERYADYFNKKYKRKGHVFCGRYRASICNDDSYLLAASVYIHLNPYRAGLCNHFKDYRWSSVVLYVESSKKTFINFEIILFLFDSQLDKARKKYSEMLEEDMKIKGSNLLDRSSIKIFIKRAANSAKKIIGKDKYLGDLDKLIEDFKSKKKVIIAKDRKARRYLAEQLLANGYSRQEIRKILFIGKTTFYRIMNFRSGGTK